MGVQRLEQIRNGLLSALPPGTPAALVQHVSTKRQRELVTTLDRLVEDAAAAAIASPAVLIVGDVLRGAQVVSESREHAPTVPRRALQN
jgi:uroporphyrin-III C-methyltransferase